MFVVLILGLGMYSVGMKHSTNVTAALHKEKKITTFQSFLQNFHESLTFTKKKKRTGIIFGIKSTPEKSLHMLKTST